MSITAQPPADGAPHPVYFDAVLRPHRSLSKPGFLILMSAVAVGGFLVGVAFCLMGAWPVMAFCGLEVGLIYVLFRLNYREGENHERLVLTNQELHVARVSPQGRVSEWRLAPNWLRVSIDDPPGHDSALRLTTHGQSLVIGAFLTPEERLEVARALDTALDRWRAGAAATPAVG
ncbi:MAG: DUF2244 domain-containing protein [Alphaproteobacteria bacterium]|nr:DUF2244 domain-containing protein [Alphaproteobacteria bacterium]